MLTRAVVSLGSSSAARSNARKASASSPFCSATRPCARCAGALFGFDFSACATSNSAVSRSPFARCASASSARVPSSSGRFASKKRECAIASS